MKSTTKSLKTSKGLITYERYDFIDEVRKRPVIWRKSEIKKRTAIERAWKDIIRVFVPYVDQLQESEQLELADHFKSTWKSIMKIMMKNYSEKEDGNTKAPLYRYTRDLDFFLKSRGLNIENVASDQELQELDKRILKRNETSRRKNGKYNPKIIDLSHESKRVKINRDTNHSKIKKCTKPLVNNSTSDTINICDGDYSQNDYRQQKNKNVKSKLFVAQPDDDADQAFFDSLKPSLCNLNDSQKLEFMVQVLKVVKKYQTNET